MEYLSLICSISLITLLGIMSPGPDFILTVKNAVTHSRKSGIFTGIGVSIGLIIHIGYCIAGISLIISKSIIAFNIIKYIGAAYLIFIGIKSLFDHKGNFDIHEKRTNDLTSFESFKMGLRCNILNPKTSIFFLGLFSVAISPSTPLRVLGIITTIIVIEGILWYSIIAIFLTQNKFKKIYQKYEGIFHKTFGGLLIYLGIKIAILEK